MIEIVKIYIIILIIATALRRKLDIYLARENFGRVVDVNFIPDYKVLLKLERKRNEITDLKNLISTKENTCVRRLFYPKVFQSEVSIQNKLERIENKIQEETEKPVFSSGHAFVCFDSLLAAYKCLSAFEEGTWKKVSIRMSALWEESKFKRSIKRMQTSTFRKFEDEDLEKEMMDPDKVHLIVDQMIEPFDIIWANIGGDRGLYVFRRIICNFIIFAVLIFFTTPTVILNSLINFRLCSQH